MTIKKSPIKSKLLISPQKDRNAYYKRIKNTLEYAINSRSYEDFKTLLKSKYRPTRNSLYKSISVQAELIAHHYDDFIALCELAPPEYKLVLMNFSGMNLASINLAGLDTFFANFNGADLTHAKNLTQQLLDQSSYERAILPDEFIAAWTKDKTALVLNEITQLGLYGKKLTGFASKEAQEKGEKAIKLAEDLASMINLTPRLNGEFQEKFLEVLRRHDVEFSTHRFYGLKRIIQNIALFVAGIGIGYLIAGTVNYYNSGNFFFFNQTTTQQKIAQIEKQVVPKAEEPINEQSLSSVK